MLKKLLIASLFLILGLTIIPVQAAAPLAQIQAMLTKPKVMCGHFAQIKQLVGFKKPLLSNGRFCVIAGKGILWRTLQPFPTTLRLTPNEIVQIQNNQVMLQMTAEQEPVVRMINSVLFSLLAGDLSQLEQLFVINGSIANNQWQVALQARDAILAQAIGTINLAGSNYVKKVITHEPNGDCTTITFSAIQSGNTAMTAEEKALFE